MIRRTKHVGLALLFLCCQLAWGQSITGTITDEKGMPLPFASVYVVKNNVGTNSNADGKYELKVPPGSYEIIFQFLGYSTHKRTIEVSSGTTNLNVQLQPEVVMLRTATVAAGAEDPAYAIMRKAIAKAKYHLLQTNSYSAKVYTKGSGQVTKIPWGFRTLAEKEGVTTDRVYTSESVSEIYFERPNTFKQKVISVRASGPNDANASPNSYITSSFYMPMVSGSVSPLSPRALSFYRFKYLGSFVDQGVEINKIFVSPRSRGENVFEGVIYIREMEFNIHSLDLSTKIENITININQVYAPVAADVWMPVTQKYDFSGGFMGAEFEYKYIASVSNYKVELNPDMLKNLTVIDEKTEEVPAAISQKNQPRKKKEDTAPEGDITRKQLQKMMDEYEREQQNNRDSSDVVADYSFTIDSMAMRHDSTYWDGVRTVPLTEAEMAGYQKADSTYLINEAKRKEDSIKGVDGARFDVGDVVVGGYYKLGEELRLDYPGLLPRFRFNTLEGFNLDLSAKLNLKKDTLTGLSLAPSIRYGFSSNVLYAHLTGAYRWGERGNSNRFFISGGRYIYEFNPDAIHPLVNTLYSLLLSRNYMRLYEQNDAAIGWSRAFNYKYKVSASALWAERNELFNQTDYTLFRRETMDFLPNEPENIETITGSFSGNRAMITTLNLEARPWLKFYKRNGILYPMRRNTTSINLNYRAGWAGIAGSKSDYQQVELGLSRSFYTGVRLTVDAEVQAGIFLRSQHIDFMDYRHFFGGLTELAPLRLTGNYRLLDYYSYSTAQSFIAFFSYLRFRRLAITQILPVRMVGIKENLILNYLKTSASPHYLEAGYAIDNIFRIFRIELVYGMTDFNQSEFGWRIGVASRLRF